MGTRVWLRLMAKGSGPASSQQPGRKGTVPFQPVATEAQALSHEPLALSHWDSTRCSALSASLLPPTADDLLELVVRPRPGAAGDLAAHRGDRGRRHRRGVLPPRAPHVGEDVGDLLVGHAGAERRHQPNRTLLAVQENARWNPRSGERQLRPDQA